MRMFASLGIASLVALAAGCSQQDMALIDSQVSAENRMNQVLRDPDSAKYEGVSAYSTDDKQVFVFCGYVNAKNAFGGYVGRSRFVAGPGSAIIEADDNRGVFQGVWDLGCKPERLVQTVPSFG